MWIVRIVKTRHGARGNERIETDYPCSTIRKEFWDDGVDVILYDVDGDPRKRIKLEMPKDGKRVYIMDANHDTKDSISWPLNRKAKDDAEDAKNTTKGAVGKDEVKDSSEVVTAATPELRVMV